MNLSQIHGGEKLRQNITGKNGMKSYYNSSQGTSLAPCKIPLPVQEHEFWLCHFEGSLLLCLCSSCPCWLTSVLSWWWSLLCAMPLFHTVRLILCWCWSACEMVLLLVLELFLSCGNPVLALPILVWCLCLCCLVLWWCSPGALLSRVTEVVLRMYLWWSLCALYLLACLMRVTVGNSGLCCCVCVMPFLCWCFRKSFQKG